MDGRESECLDSDIRSLKIPPEGLAGQQVIAAPTGRIRTSAAIRMTCRVCFKTRHSSKPGGHDVSDLTDLSKRNEDASCSDQEIQAL